MAFTFSSTSGKEYTYPNVGQRNGVVAKLGEGNLAWDEVRSKQLEDDWICDNNNRYRLLYRTLATIRNSKYFPFRTGRLKNSIRYRMTEYGFEIYIDDDVINGAPYQYFLEFGTKLSRKHEGFWYKKIFNEVARMIKRTTHGFYVEEKGGKK
mgnify:FL=1